jgi:DNA-binding NarL/FixJ family response regulator
MIRIFLAEDNPALRSALALILRARLGAAIVGEAASYLALRQALECSQAGRLADVLIVDWDLPGQARPGWVAELKRRSPGLRVVVLSARPEAALAAQAEHADGFVNETDPPEAILEALRTLEATA